MATGGLIIGKQSRAAGVDDIQAAAVTTASVTQDLPEGIAMVPSAGITAAVCQ